MKALTYTRYGPPDVVHVSDVPVPEPGVGEVLVRVHASAVNTSDWRIRAAAFPGVTALPGRLMFGLLRPRNPRLGSEFSGVVDALGEGATRFSIGDRVFGFTASGGASAEFLAVSETSAVAKIPDGTTFEEAAALPFGGLCSLVFLQQFAGLREGQNLLIVGASGGVGAYAVQIAKALGAHVTGISGSASQAFVQNLGADVTLDYRVTKAEEIAERFDVILDTVGTLRPSTARKMLKDSGQFFPLNMGLRELAAAFLNFFGSRKVRLAVNRDTPEDLERLAELVASGAVKPVIDSIFDLKDAQEAHAFVEGRHRQGAVVLRVSG